MLDAVRRTGDEAEMKRQPDSRIADMGGWLDDDHEAEDAVQPQIQDAIAHIDRDPSTLVRWPFADLSAMTGPMGAGEVWFTAAFSGGGKTTFVVSCIEAWRQEGKRVYVMPLELEPFRFRTYLACMQTKIHPGDALSGQLRSDPTRDVERSVLKDAVRAQDSKEYRNHVRISSQRSIGLAGLEDGLRRAKSFGADVVVIDHIDHLTGAEGASMYQESVRINDAALTMAQDNGMLLWFTSQLNMELAKGKDHLAKFGAPMPQHMMFPTAKIKNATGIIGLFRPIRRQRPDEAEETYKAEIAAARSGQTDATTALEPNVVGVTMMKLRNYGQNDGKKVLLGFERGRVVSLNEKDRYTTAGGRPLKVI